MPTSGPLGHRARRRDDAALHLQLGAAWSFPSARLHWHEPDDDRVAGGRCGRCQGLRRFKAGTVRPVGDRRALANRQTAFNAGAADANCWHFAVPAYATVVNGATAQEDPFGRDDVLTRVARTIIRRHPRQFCQLAASNFWNGFWQTWIHIPLLLTCLAGCWLFWRRRLAVLVCRVCGRPAVRRHHPRVPDELPDRSLSVAYKLRGDSEPAPADRDDRHTLERPIGSFRRGTRTRETAPSSRFARGLDGYDRCQTTMWLRWPVPFLRLNRSRT